MKKYKLHISSDISKKDFKDFFEGNMNENQKDFFLQQVEKDEFLKDAFRGYESNPDAFNDIYSIDKTIKTKTTNNNHSKHVKIFSSIAVIITVIISFYVINKSKTSPENNLTKNSTLIDTHHLNVINREIEHASLIPASEQITSLKTVTVQKQVNLFEKEMPIEMINKLRAISIDNNSDSKNENLPMVEHYKYLPVDYMYELKVIDYTKTNRTKIKKDFSDGGSLAPKYENRQNSLDTILADNNSNIVPYNEFLKESMGKFSSNNFKVALQDFIVILQHYPEDQNAHFYGGLCYYNIGLYENAITFFDAILETNVATFTQEALWYKALSLINNNQEKEAENILNKIIEAKGFYSNQANELLKEIK